MRSLMLWCLLVLSPLAGAQVWQPDGDQVAALAKSVESRWQRMFSSQGLLRERQTSVDLAGLSLDAVAVGYPPERTTLMLNALLAMVDDGVFSNTRGNMYWYQGDSKVVDRNGVEFVIRKAAIIWLLYRDRLTEAQRVPLLKMLNLAKTGIGNHVVRISYTNIFLMKTWNMIALGEALDDAALAKQGYSMLADWLAHTARTGINEYLSPSYYDIDLECLALIHNLSRETKARQMARRALDYFWAEITLNWYSPAERLGGAHSRDYNRLFNIGGLNSAFIRGGLAAVTPPVPDDPYEFYSRDTAPKAAHDWLAEPWPRYVSGRWGEEAEKRWHQFIGRNFSIGSTESTYPSGHDNAPLVINLGSGQDVPIINFFMDGRRDYYGQNKTLEAGSGHMKALHLRPFLSSVQHDHEVLFAATVTGKGPENVVLESVITLPADAEYWLDNRKLDLDTHSSAWLFDYAPNGSSTKIDIQQNAGRIELQLSDADKQQGVGISRVFPVKAGENYRIGAALAGGQMSLYLNYLDASKKLIGSELIKSVKGGDNGFATQEFAARAPAGAVWCKAWLYSPSTATTQTRIADLYFDQLTPQVQRMGSFDFSVFRPASIAVLAGATLFVRRQDAVAAIRLAGAWDVAGKAVGFTLHNDGLAYRAVRLTATHASEHSESRGTIAAWARAEDGIRNDVDFAALRQRVLKLPVAANLQGDVLEVSAGPLRLKVDVDTSRRLLREGMKPVPADATLWLDGRDLAPELIAPR